MALLMIETVNCITCANWTPKAGDPKLAKQGFAPCKVWSEGKKWVTFGATYERECKHHRKAPEQVTDKRKEWLDAQSR